MLKRKSRPVERLQHKLQRTGRVDELGLRETPAEERNFVKRVIGPVMRRLQQFAATALPGAASEDLRRRLRMAGNPGNMTATTFVALQVLVMILMTLAGFFLALGLALWKATASVMGIPQWILLIALFAVSGFLLPSLYLNRKTRQRQRIIWKTLPDVLDLLAISVEAGLGFDLAMDRVGQRYRGILGEELQRTNREINMGRSRAEAMRDLGLRTGVDELTSVVSAITQADRLGVSIGSVLSEQAQQLREQRAQRAREQAQKAPNKMMLPLVGCIFPAMFIVLLGPALLKMASGWKEIQGAMGTPPP